MPRPILRLAVLLSLAAVAEAAPLAGVRALAVAPDGSHVYAASEFADALAVFRRDPDTGALAAIQTVGTRPGGPFLDATAGVALSPDGRHLYVSAFGARAVNVFTVDPVSGLASFVAAAVDDRDGVDGLGSAHGLVVSPDGAHVYVAGFEDGAIAVFARDTASGTLAFVEAVRDVDGLAGVLQLAIAPDGAHLYAAAAGDDAVAVFARDAASGALAFRQVLRNGAGGVSGLRGARTVRVAPDGMQVYVGSGGFPGPPADHALVTLARDPATGLLAFVDSLLDDVAGVEGLGGVYDLDVAPDGATLYAASFGDNAVATFDRDATGRLAFRQVRYDGGVRLGAAHALATSPDGAHLYVAAFGAPGIQTLVRDAGGTTAPGPFIGSGDDGCPAEPPAYCRAATRAKLVVHRGGPRPGLRFAWRRGAATTRAELGDPVAGTTDYALCLWTVGPAPTLLVAGVAPANGVSDSGWHAARGGLAHADPTSDANGLRSLALYPGGDGQSGLRAAMAGALTAQPLAGALHVVARQDDGTCWAASFELRVRGRGGRDVLTGIR